MITTSRYASEKTRIFAKKLAEKRKTRYYGRRKKTIDYIVEIARKKGDNKIIIIIEKKDKPKFIRTIRIKCNGTWAWLPKEIEIDES